MEFGKDIEDRYSAGDLQNMFYKDENEEGSKMILIFLLVFTVVMRYHSAFLISSGQ